MEELDPRKDEERRALLREVEVRVMQYQDELEGGRKTVKAGWTVAEQVAPKISNRVHSMIDETRWSITAER